MKTRVLPDISRPILIGSITVLLSHLGAEVVSEEEDSVEEGSEEGRLDGVEETWIRTWPWWMEREEEEDGGDPQDTVEDSGPVPVMEEALEDPLDHTEETWVVQG